MVRVEKAIRIACAICILLLIPMASYAQTEGHPSDGSRAKQPKIVFETMAHDFGTVQPMTNIKHSFVFKNQGSDALLIEKVKAGWGCTAALATAGEIPPGGEGKIDVSFKPGNRQGIQSKTINVTTNDPSNRQLKLKVSAQVEMVLAIEPAAINFLKINAAEGSKEPLYARLSGTESDSTKIVSVESKNKFLNVEIEPGGFDNDPARQIRFIIKPGMPVGRFRERIVFKTDHKSVNTLHLYVRGEALGNIVVDPKHLPLGMITLDKAIDKTIRVYSTTDSFTFNVTDVKSTVQGLQTALKTITPGKEYTIVCSMEKGDLPPIVRGEIVITTDDKAQNSITVRVFGRLDKRPVPREKKAS